MHNQLHQPMNTSTDIYNEQKEAESKEQEAGVGKKQEQHNLIHHNGLHQSPFSREKLQNELDFLHKYVTGDKKCYKYLAAGPEHGTVTEYLAGKLLWYQ